MTCSGYEVNGTAVNYLILAPIVVIPLKVGIHITFGMIRLLDAGSSLA